MHLHCKMFDALDSSVSQQAIKIKRVWIWSGLNPAVRFFLFALTGRDNAASTAQQQQP